MKRVVLKDNSVIYSLTESEIVKYKSDSESLVLLRKESIEDLVYSADAGIYYLYKIKDEFLYDLGDGVCYVSEGESGFNFLLNAARNRQLINRNRFMSHEVINDLFDMKNVEKRVRSFRVRNELNKKKLNVNDIRKEISQLKQAAFSYDKEYLSVLIYIKRDEFCDVKYIDMGFLDGKMCFVMTNPLGKDFSPVDALIKIFESEKLGVAW